MSKKPELEVDASLNVAYVVFSDEEVAETVEITPEVQVDLDVKGSVVGVELLDLGADIPVGRIAYQYKLDAAQVQSLRGIRQAIGGFNSTVSTGSGAAADTLLAPAV